MGGSELQLSTVNAQQSHSIGATEKEASQGISADAGTLQALVHTEKHRYNRKNSTPDRRKLEAPPQEMRHAVTLQKLFSSSFSLVLVRDRFLESCSLGKQLHAGFLESRQP
jgi:hypothetical protein